MVPNGKKRSRKSNRHNGCRETSNTDESQDSRDIDKECLQNQIREKRALGITPKNKNSHFLKKVKEAKHHHSLAHSLEPEELLPKPLESSNRKDSNRKDPTRKDSNRKDSRCEESTHRNRNQENEIETLEVLEVFPIDDDTTDKRFLDQVQEFRQNPIINQARWVESQRYGDQVFRAEKDEERANVFIPIATYLGFVTTVFTQVCSWGIPAFPTKAWFCFLSVFPLSLGAIGIFFKVRAYLRKPR